MKILLALDESSFSQAAMDAVLNQAHPKDTEVLILHVLEPAYAHGHTLGYVPEVLQIMEEERENGKNLLARASKQLCEKGFNVTTALEIGNPKILIVDLAAEWHADLIVVGSQGLKGLNRFLLGSVSETVARHANCSVQIVRPLLKS